MKRILISLSLGLLVSLVTCNSAWAQATAQINGSVQDSSGAVLPGVEITATQTETGVGRMTVSNEAGLYVLPNLPLGPYKVEAALPGFRTFAQSGIVLQVGDNPRINITLQVGQVSEQVEVQANASLVETRNVSVGQVMETQRILDLPLNVRDPAQLVLLNGASMQVTPSGGYSFGGTRMAIATAGGFGTGTDYTLDGIRHIDPFDSLPLPLPFPDALSEFKTEIGGQAASQGRGSQVSAVTKSGTNQFHGDFFEFVRNDLFNARQYFAVKNSSLKRNQFGGTIGGPIFRNKLFFFGGYQGTLTRQDPANNEAFLPTPAMLAGDFSTFASSQCQTRPLTLGGPFANNRVNPALFSPAALNIVKQLPKVDDPCGHIRYGGRNPINDNEIIGRMDYQLSTRHSLFGRYYVATEDQPSAWKFDPGNVLLAPVVEFNPRNQSYTAGSTFLVSSNLVNSFRATFTDLRVLYKGNNWFSACDMGVNIYCGLGGNIKFMQLSISGGFALNQRSRPDDHLNTKTYDIDDNLSWTKGKHQLSF